MPARSRARKYGTISSAPPASRQMWSPAVEELDGFLGVAERPRRTSHVQARGNEPRQEVVAGCDILRRSGDREGTLAVACQIDAATLRNRTRTL